MADETVEVEVRLKPEPALAELNDLQDQYKKLMKAIQDSTEKIDKKQGRSIWERFALTRGMADFGAKRMQATGRRFQIPTGGGAAVRAGLSMAERRGDTKAIGQAVYGATSLLSKIAPALMTGAKVGGVAAAFMAGPTAIESVGPQVMAAVEAAFKPQGAMGKAWDELSDYVTAIAAELSKLNAEIKAPFKAGADVMGIAKAALRLGGDTAALDMENRYGEFQVLRQFHRDNIRYMRAIESQKEVVYGKLYGDVMNTIGAKLKNW